MATQLKHTNFTYSPPAAHVRVAFQRSTATAAVAASLGKLPASVRDATLEDIAGAGEQVPDWHQALEADRQAVIDCEAATDESDPDNLLGEAESKALHRVLLTPAPDPVALAIKARIYEDTTAYHLGAADDIARLFASETLRFATDGTGEPNGVSLAVRGAARDEIASNAAVPLPGCWHRALSRLRAAEAVAEGTPAEDEKAFSDAWSTVADAQRTVLTTAAPTMKELGEKVSFYFAIDAHEFDEPAIGASISADVKRLVVVPESTDDPAWIAAVDKLNEVAAKLAVRGLDDDTVDALATEQTAATEALVDLPSRSAADVLAKMRALSDLNLSVETAQLTPLLAELESFTTAGRAPAYSPYMRGPLIQWQKAYAIYEEARAAVIAFDRDVHTPARARWQEFGKRLTPDDLRNLDPEAATAAADFDVAYDRYYHLVDAEGDAADRLLQLPAPGPAELAIKLRLATEAYGWNTVKTEAWETLFLADARRFGRVGAYTQADDALLAAYWQQRSVVEPNIDVDDLGAIDEAAYFAIFDATMDVINAARAATVEGVLAKLRVAFRDGAGQRWSDRAIIDPSHPDFRAGLATSSPTDRLLWSAIEDLARIGGISLGKQGA